MWEQCIAIILPEITTEFNPKYPNMLGIGQQVGLIVGTTALSLVSWTNCSVVYQVRRCGA